MTRELELHCRDELRQARAAVLRDAEAFPEILFALERIGAALLNRDATLGKYRPAFIKLFTRLSAFGPDEIKSVGRLYDLVQRGRNEALHQGAFARHVAAHAVELALAVEEALVNESDVIGDYMVSLPLVAYEWQPLRVVRHQMLANSFSFLPILIGHHGWRAVSDIEIARVLRSARNPDERGARLGASIAAARRDFNLQLTTPRTAAPQTSVREILQDQGNTPVLVVGTAGELLGIATPFDLL